MKLIDYINTHAKRCKPEADDVDVIFFGVRKGPDATADALKAAIAQHEGVFCSVDPFDGKEHGYIELGGWVGNPAAALSLIGLGVALGLWNLLTPKTMFGNILPPELVQQMAGSGLVCLQAAAQEAIAEVTN